MKGCKDKMEIFEEKGDRKKSPHARTPEQRAIDCMVQHIKMFHIQACKEAAADFSEPCEKCPYADKCDFDWLSIMDPLHSKSSISINIQLAYEGPSCIQDNDWGGTGI